MIISFSGIDSAGKSTQVELLMSYCESNDIRAKRVWSKARGTPGVILLKSIVRRDKKMDDDEKQNYRNSIYADSRKSNLLYTLSLLDLCWYWGIYYRILSLTNKIIICDRYLWDTYVELKYDFHNIDIDHSSLWNLVRKITPRPRTSFVFVVPPEVSLERDKKKDADGIESVERKRQKINTYLELINNGCWTNVMDGMESVESLHEKVISIINTAIRR